MQEANLIQFSLQDLIHPIVNADAAPADDHGGEADDRWDAWTKWILPWLWSCVYTLTVNTPYDIFKWCWKIFWDYIKYGASYGF